MSTCVSVCACPRVSMNVVCMSMCVSVYVHVRVSVYIHACMSNKKTININTFLSIL